MRTIVSAHGEKRPVHVFPKKLDRESPEELHAEFAAEIQAAKNGRNLNAPLRTTVILSPWTASLFMHEVIGHTAETDVFRILAESGRVSLFRRATHVDLDVIDEPLGPVDDEGSPTRTKKILSGGYWTEVLGMRSDENRWGTAATGNARKASHKDSVLPRMSKTYIQGRGQPLEKLIGSVDSGVICFGAWGGRGNENRYVIRPTYAREIRNGKLTEGVLRGFDIAGDKFEDLSALAGLGDVCEMYRPPYPCNKGRQLLQTLQGSTALLFEQLTLRPIRTGA